MPTNNGLLTVEPVSGSELLMHNFGNKLARGVDLTSAERFAACTIVAQDNANRFGPTPDTFTVEQPDLPESVKGAIADYNS